MPYTGVNQSSSWLETQRVIKKYLDKGYDVRVHRQEFGAPSKEHDSVEYEVYVDFKEDY